MSSRSRSGGLVYSTEGGRMCPGCRRPVAACLCKAVPDRPAGDGIVRVSFERKGRAGKGVTLLRGLDLDDAALVELTRVLKAACAVGGTVDGAVVELQGDQRDRAIPVLQARGFRVRRAGG